MLKPTELAELLKQHPAPKIAALAGLSLKTVYRIRDGANSPTFDTMERIANALMGIKSPPRNTTNPLTQGLD